ncbi:DUF4350 domain-containing protein [Candidatus Parabeggiatoa sp. HSG14]|uniref:DUF4350 domain-containing protein n=1 Tax=Candidatus Parabeggiatoa sp. HSG14 TaxID=3055593 RepID=UPI0025A7AA8F|nr:DUF4350 domain-containing protein [Thiotrichales bacterium HSG14]
MKRSIIIILTIFIVGIIFSTSYWFYNNFEFVKETVEIGYQDEARDNPRLATELLLERMGANVESIHAFPDDIEYMLSSQDTLILLEYNSFLDTEQSRQILQWVREGGHLMMVSDTIYDFQGKTSYPDPLFTILRLYQYQNELDNLEITHASPTDFIWEQYPMQVAFNPDYYLESSYYDSEVEIGDNYGIHFLRYYYGIGIISVLSDLAFIENDKIGEYDHAQFFWLIVNFERLATKIWLLSPETEFDSGEGEQKTLWTLLWKNLWTVIISIIVLLLFWLLSAAQRFGPLLPAPSRTRRRLLEHIEASGRFLWQQKQAHILLSGARQALLKRLESVHPDWIRLSHAELSQRLAQICELPANEIEHALNPSHFTKGEQIYTEIDFTRTFQILAQIRKTL